MRHTSCAARRERTVVTHFFALDPVTHALARVQAARAGLSTRAWVRRAVERAATAPAPRCEGGRP